MKNLKLNRFLSLRKQLILVASFCLLTSASGAQRRIFETTRLMGTGGAGMASILGVDSLYGNPAGSAFFNDSLVYIHSNSGELKSPSSFRSLTPYGDEPSHRGLVIMDSSNQTTRGGVGYLKFQERFFERTQYSLNLTAPMGKSTSFGINYHFIQDENTSGTEQTRHVAHLGLLKIASEKLSFGAVLYDPFKSDGDQAKGWLGVQYVLIPSIVVMADYGLNPFRSLSKTQAYRLGTQVNFYEDFYLRGGLFDDKLTNLRGNAYGIGWIGPRLSLDVAVKRSVQKNDLNNILLSGEKLSELSFALTYKI